MWVGGFDCSKFSAELRGRRELWWGFWWVLLESESLFSSLTVSLFGIYVKVSNLLNNFSCWEREDPTGSWARVVHKHRWVTPLTKRLTVLNILIIFIFWFEFWVHEPSNGSVHIHKHRWVTPLAKLLLIFWLVCSSSLSFLLFKLFQGNPSPPKLIILEMGFLLLVDCLNESFCFLRENFWQTS